MKKPTLFKEIGEPFARQGVLLVAEERPRDIRPYQACEGCFYNSNCTSALACSSFDRRDGKNVWFKVVD